MKNKNIGDFCFVGNNLNIISWWHFENLRWTENKIKYDVVIKVALIVYEEIKM